MAEDPSLAPPQNASAKLQDAAILGGINVQRVSKGMRDEVLKLLVNLRDELIAEMGSSKVMTDWKKQRYTDLITFANATIDSAYTKIGNKTAKDVGGIGVAEIKKLGNAVNNVLGVSVSAAMSAQQLEAIANTEKMLVQGATQKEWWNKQATDLQHGFSATIKDGMIRGKSIDEMKKPVADLMGNTPAQAEALIRTAVATVQSEAQQDYYAANDDIIKGVQWVATLDKRTSPVCRAYDSLSWVYHPDQGKMTPVGHDKPWLGYPPIHFNCRSTTIPVLRSWQELSGMKLTKDEKTYEESFQDNLAKQGFSEEEIAGITDDQRASMDGQVAEELTYEEWLKTKDENFQKEVLGPQRWQLWQDGKLDLGMMIDGNGEPLTIPELHQAIEDNVAVPQTTPEEGDHGLSLAERSILSAQLTAGNTQGEYHTTWLDQTTGKTTDQTLTHSLTDDELSNLHGWTEKTAGREVPTPQLTHLSNALGKSEFWDVTELKTWTGVPGWQESKLVMGDGKVATVALKASQSWTADDVAKYQEALPGCTEKTSSVAKATACAFKATGKVTFAITSPGAVKLDPKAMKAVYPPLKEKPAPYVTPKVKKPTPEELHAQAMQETLAKQQAIADQMAKDAAIAREKHTQLQAEIAAQRLQIAEEDYQKTQAFLAAQEAEVKAAKEAAMKETLAKAEKAQAEAALAREQAQLLSAQRQKTAAQVELETIQADWKAAQDALQAAQTGPDGFPVDPHQLKQIQSLGGSTGALLVEDKQGTKYVLKQGANAGHIQSEVTADQLYRVMGVNVPEPKLYSTPEGPTKLAKFIDGAKTLEAYLASASPSAKAAIFSQLQDGFVADALVGNWDVIGLNRDNILVDKNGTAWRADNGGALEYRAMGKKKAKGQFGPEVTELKTFLDGSNARTKEVFNGISQEQINDQIARIVANRQAILDATPKNLRKVMGERIDYLEAYAKPSATVTGMSTWGSASHVQAEVTKAKVNGYALFSDKDWVEDLQALTWWEKDAQGNVQTVVQFKGTPVMDEAMKVHYEPLFGPGSRSAAARSQSAPTIQSLPEDVFYADLKSASGNINHYHSFGGTTPNMAKMAKAEAHLPTLINLHNTSADPAVKEMATKYIGQIAAIKSSLASLQSTGKLTSVPWLDQYSKPIAPPPAQVIQAPTAPATMQFSRVAYDPPAKSFSNQGEAKQTGGNTGMAGDAMQVKHGDVTITYLPMIYQNNSVWSLWGTTTVRINGEATPANMQKIQGALKDLGVDVTPPTEEYQKAVYLARNVYLKNSNNIPDEIKTALANRQISDAEILAKVAEVAKRDFKLELKPKDDRWKGNVSAETQGWRNWDRLDLTRDQLKAKMKPGAVIWHDFYYGGNPRPPHELIGAFIDSGGQLTPTAEKNRKGLPLTGSGSASPTSDLATGGSSYYFMRLREASWVQSLGNYGGKMQAVYDIGHLARTDAWSFGRDVFGDVRSSGSSRKVSPAEMNKHVNGGSNETDFKNGFSLYDAKYLVVRPGDRQAVIDAIKAKGIAKWPDGRSIEEVVVVARDVQA